MTGEKQEGGIRFGENRTAFETEIQPPRISEREQVLFGISESWGQKGTWLGAVQPRGKGQTPSGRH